MIQDRQVMNLVFARTPFFKQTLFDYENKQIYLISKTNQRLLENAWEVCTSVGTSVGKHTIKATKPDQVTIHHHMCWKGLGAISHKNNTTSPRITAACTCQGTFVERLLWTWETQVPRYCWRYKLAHTLGKNICPATPCPHYKVEPPSGTKRNENKNEPLWASTL